MCTRDSSTFLRSTFSIFTDCYGAGKKRAERIMELITMKRRECGVYKHSLSAKKERRRAMGWFHGKTESNLQISMFKWNGKKSKRNQARFSFSAKHDERSTEKMVLLREHHCEYVCVLCREWCLDRDEKWKRKCSQMRTHKCYAWPIRLENDTLNSDVWIATRKH